MKYLLLILFYPIVIFSQTYYETKLISPSLNSILGTDIAIKYPFVYAGDGYNDYFFIDAGYMFIYKWEDNIWKVEQAIPPPMPRQHGNFGFKFDVFDDELLILELRNYSSHNVVYYFSYIDGIWQEKQVLQKTNPSRDVFGMSFTQNEEFVFISDNNYLLKNLIYVYEKGDSIILVDSLEGKESFIRDFFGSRMKAIDNILLTAADYDTNFGYETGSIYVFEKDDSNRYVEIDKLVPSYLRDYDNFGRSFDIDENWLIVGACGEPVLGVRQGRVIIYKRDGKNFTESQILYSPDDTTGNYFGNSVSIYNNRLLIGSPWAKHNGLNSGKAYLYKFKGNFWELDHIFIPSDPQNSLYYGMETVLDDSIIAITAWNTTKGGLYLYTTSKPINIKNEDTHSINDYFLYQNYPNPFNPKTIIKFNIPHDGLVKIIVYDILGNEITKLVDEYKIEGIYEIEFDGSQLPSGVYFYKLFVNEFVSTKKLILLK